MIFVIDRSKSTLRFRAGVLELEQKGRKVQQVPVNPLEQVVIYGNPLVETTVWRVLSEAGVPVIILPDRKRPAAVLGSGLAVRLPLRRLQHQLAADPTTRLATAKWFVLEKMNRYALPLHTVSDLWPEAATTCTEFSDKVQGAQEQVTDADSLQTLLGIEGHVAQAWFALLAHYLPEELRFTGRNRRPPRDPINSLLSLGYTLLLSEVRQAALRAGFDPSLGFLHQDYPGRESLALDFSELFRAGVDRFVLTWLRTTEPDSSFFFYRKGEGCRLSKTTRPLFFTAWAEYREQWPRPEQNPEQSREEGCEESELETTPLRELLNGQTARFGSFLKQQGD
ncbi:MAG: CRISPR-associated endonuclease Cas1, partial [Candidatus Electrothrix sp. ATG2]|nr:CRISPR-associated endonuclease Cas1 [Candidatus Electrothrix sp. ATG2]